VDRFIILPSVLFDIEGDAFGKIYEYFLGKFAMTEGQKGGEFFTPMLRRGNWKDALVRMLRSCRKPDEKILI
jgi:hypothetical protein